MYLPLSKPHKALVDGTAMKISGFQKAEHVRQGMRETWDELGKEERT